MCIAPRISSLSKEMEEIRGELCKQVATIEFDDTLHISLSKTFYVKHWQIEPLKRKLMEDLRTYNTLNKAITLHKWSVYCNERKTRSFLALDCDEETSSELASLVKTINDRLRGFGLDPYYEVPPIAQKYYNDGQEARFHASLFWAPSDAIGGSILDDPSLDSIKLPQKLTDMELWFKFGDKKVKIL